MRWIGAAHGVVQRRARLVRHLRRPTVLYLRSAAARHRRRSAAWVPLLSNLCTRFGKAAALRSRGLRSPLWRDERDACLERRLPGRSVACARPPIASCTSRSAAESLTASCETWSGPSPSGNVAACTRIWTTRSMQTWSPPGVATPATGPKQRALKSRPR